MARGGTDSQRAELDRRATDELADQCQRLEDDLEELKAKYEMYFLGVDRLEPVRRREEMKRNIARLKSAFTRNTGLRFRIETLHARFLSYERMWLRAARQKEDGTYRRDLFKARRRVGAGTAKQVKPDEKKPAATDEDVDLSDWNESPSKTAAAPPAVPPVPPPLVKANAPPVAAATKPSAPQQPAAPRTPSAASLTDVQMRSLYDAYILAKKRCAEDVSRLTFEAVSRSVSKQIPEILTRFKAKAVDFKVVIKDGKAILKAVPKT